jgi:hypothetical protein
MTPDTAPMTLADAVALYFPRGGLTVSSLRTEARKGRLRLVRIAGKDLVTPAAIERMIALCQEPHAARTSQSESPPDAGRSGKSEMAERCASARAAVLMTARELKSGLRNTSPRNTGQPSASVIRPAFPSRTP